MKFGVIVYPGSNCDEDTFFAINDVLNKEIRYIWHEETDISDIDVIIIPGGFSYGDYLRCGAIAQFSPISNSIIEHANKGKYVLGICNGFQILTEMGLLPGALIRNVGLKFICKDVMLKVENPKTQFTRSIKKNVIKIPIAHGEGNYRIDEQGLKELIDNEQIVFRYSSFDGEISDEYNPNGSVSNIAGICNKNRNVLGMMPHPERACQTELGGTDGNLLLSSLF